MSDRLRDTQQFFGPKAAGWEDRFPDDGPQYERAVSAMALPLGATALDVGCGTGRALAPLRAAVGPTGRVLGLDATPEMLAAGRRAGRDQLAALLLGDASRLPLPANAVEAVFAAGLLPHLENPAQGLAELARVTRAGGQLVVFHPIGRRALAARHQRVPTDDDVLAPARLQQLCAGAGWRLLQVDDVEERYWALALRL